MLRIAALLALLAGPAFADEAWTTAAGMAFWEADVAETSVFSVAVPTGSLRLYIPGLNARIEKRGVHQAYWIGDAEGPCGATLTGPDGVASSDWGLGTIAFDTAAFPSGWTATLGRCGAIPAFNLRAEPWWDGIENE